MYRTGDVAFTTICPVRDTWEDLELYLTHARSARGELLALRDGRKIPLGRCLAGSGGDELVFEALVTVVYNAPFSS